MNKKLKIVVAVLVVLFLIIIGVRLISGEDNWICKNGNWVKHGNPSATMPTTPCE
jgi:hypothetical protein